MNQQLHTGKRTLSPQHLAALAAGRERRKHEGGEITPELAPWQVKSPVRRFTADMIDPWFLDRLEKVWPGHSAATWRGRFLGFGQSNEYLPICNDRAVLLAVALRQPMTGQPIVMEVLAWSRDATEGWLSRDKSQAVFALYARCRQWLSGMKGERMVLGLCSDVRGDTIARHMIEEGGAEGAPLVDVGPYKR